MPHAGPSAPSSRSCSRAGSVPTLRASRTSAWRNYGQAVARNRCGPATPAPTPVPSVKAGKLLGYNTTVDAGSRSLTAASPWKRDATISSRGGSVNSPARSSVSRRMLTLRGFARGGLGRPADTPAAGNRIRVDHNGSSSNVTLTEAVMPIWPNAMASPTSSPALPAAWTDTWFIPAPP